MLLCVLLQNSTTGAHARKMKKKDFPFSFLQLPTSFFVTFPISYFFSSFPFTLSLLLPQFQLGVWGAL